MYVVMRWMNILMYWLYCGFLCGVAVVWKVGVGFNFFDILLNSVIANRHRPWMTLSLCTWHREDAHGLFISGSRQELSFLLRHNC